MIARNPPRDLYEPVPRLLPPPFEHLDSVVRNKATGEVGFLYVNGADQWIDWQFPDMDTAKKELAVYG